MMYRRKGNVCSRVFSFVASVSIFLFCLLCHPTFGQGGNTISGHVFGADRRPLPDLNVELQDDLWRTISRGRTNSSGRYFFAGLSAGRFRVRVLPLGTDYEEQEQDVEIINFNRTSGAGITRITGNGNESKDFYLHRKKTATGLGAPGTVFAQEVPEHAERLYRQGLSHLENKRMRECYSSIKAAIEVFPQYFAALETLGVEYLKAEYFDAARVLLTIAVNVNPRAYNSWYGLASALTLQNKHFEALNAAEKAIELNGLARESLLLAGTLSRQAKDYAKAEKYLLKAREASGDVIPRVHWELALLYGNGLKRYKEAAKELRMYLKARPDDKNAESLKKLIADFEAKAKTS